MVTKPLLAALALCGGIAAPSLVAAQDLGGGGTSGFSMMGGPGDGPWGGFDFARADADGDGKVTKQELAAYRQAGVAGIDADGDHMISAEELTVKMMAEAQSRVEAQAKARIEAQDANGDGKLSVEELMAPRMGTRLFDRADADGDGAVSAAEVQAMRERMGAMHERAGRGMGKGHGMRGHGMGWHGMGGWFGGDDGATEGDGAAE